MDEATYRARKEELLHDFAGTKNATEKLRLESPHNALDVTNCEECTGDTLLNCKNCSDAFTMNNSEYCSHVVNGENDKYCMDVNTFDNSELAYYSSSLEQDYHILFANLTWYSQECFYSNICFNSKNIFGCSGMKKHAYCILNKQYTEKVYNELVPKIIEHMQGTGEWGEYFPPSCSPFAYNESIAQENFPLTKDEVLTRGWCWSDYQQPLPKVEKTIPAHDLPSAIEQTPDDILNWAIECEATKRLFKIIKQELDFYRRMKLPVPHLHPDERHRLRMALRNPRKLWHRNCDKCQKPIETSYSPGRPEVVYCEQCFLETVY
jgi:hypothetical protein